MTSTAATAPPIEAPPERSDSGEDPFAIIALGRFGGTVAEPPFFYTSLLYACTDDYALDDRAEPFLLSRPTYFMVHFRSRHSLAELLRRQGVSASASPVGAWFVEPPANPRVPVAGSARLRQVPVAGKTYLRCEDEGDEGQGAYMHFRAKGVFPSAIVRSQSQSRFLDGFSATTTITSLLESHGQLLPDEVLRRTEVARSAAWTSGPDDSVYLGVWGEYERRWRDGEDD